MQICITLFSLYEFSLKLSIVCNNCLNMYKMLFKTFLLKSKLLLNLLKFFMDILYYYIIFKQIPRVVNLISPKL